MEDKNKEKLISIVEEISGNKLDKIDFSNTDIRDQLKLDSMQFVHLFSRIELEFNVELPLSLMNVSNLNEFFSEFQQIIEK